jgi:DNA-binding NarL/FixJ family response regulator
MPVISAPNDPKGIELFRAHGVVVLLDMTMPKMDGVSCFNALQQIRSDVSVLLSSGYSEQEAIDCFGSRGPAGFLQKPHMPDALITILEQILKKHG